MSTLTAVFLAVLLSILMMSFFFLIRNEFVYKIRSWFIDNQFEDYEYLPNYSDMLYWYPTRWTVKQWQDYVKEKKLGS